MVLDIRFSVSMGHAQVCKQGTEVVFLLGTAAASGKLVIEYRLGSKSEAFFASAVAICPSSDDLRQMAGRTNGGSGSTGW